MDHSVFRVWEMVPNTHLQAVFGKCLMEMISHLSLNPNHSFSPIHLMLTLRSFPNPNPNSHFALSNQTHLEVQTTTSAALAWPTWEREMTTDLLDWLISDVTGHIQVGFLCDGSPIPSDPKNDNS